MADRQAVLDTLEGKRQTISLVYLGHTGITVGSIAQPIRLRLACAGRYVETPSPRGTHTYWKLVECFGRVVAVKSWPSQKWIREINQEAQRRWPGIQSELALRPKNS